MSNKISKKKQMFSLLNYKFASMWDESVAGIDDKSINETVKFSSDYSPHLLNKVYNFYKSIIQNLNSGLIALDLNGEINFINYTAVQLLGYEREELLGKNINDLFAEDPESRKLLRGIF
ncbi:MAG: PAS domain-containing protein, partial [Calditrichota bacterium]